MDEFTAGNVCFLDASDECINVKANAWCMNVHELRPYCNVDGEWTTVEMAFESD